MILSEDRARAWGGLISAALLILAIALFGKLLAPALSDPHGRPIASDFDAFWSSGYLAAHGKAALAYDLKTLGATESLGAIMDNTLFCCLYPPIWLLICLVLGTLPYMPAMLLFLAGGYAATIAWLRHMLPRPWPLLPILAFPAGLINFIAGQNGFVTGGCFAGAAFLLDRRPRLAGACLGLLAFKPHLAICVPVALLAARRWAALFSCAATALALGLLSWAVFGTATWQAFLAASALFSGLMQNPEVAPKLISTMEAVRLLHGGSLLAWSAQGASAAAGLACLTLTAARRPGAVPEIATLAAATFLCTPYALDYDMVCLGVPLAWLAASGSRSGWRGGEKPALIAAYFLPVAVRNINIAVGLPLAPFCLAALMAVLTARSLRLPRQ